MTTATGRKLLAEALKVALPGWQIIADPREIDTVRKPGAVLLYTAKRTRPAKLGLDWLTDEIELFVITATDKPELIEDDLDGLLLQVMEALEPLEGFGWTEATRETLADRFHTWKLPITCGFKITREDD